MSPLTLGIILLCAWALAHFSLLPLARDRWKAADYRQRMLRAGALVVLEKTRDMAAVGIVSLAALMLIVGIAGILSSVGFGAPKAAIAAMASIYDLAKTIAEDYSFAIGAFGVVVAVIVLYSMAKYARRRMAEAWQDKAKEVHARIVGDFHEVAAALEDDDLKPFAEEILARVHRLTEDDAAAPEAKLKASDRESLQEEIGHWLSLLAIEKARKELSVDQALAVPAAGENEAAPSGWRRVWRIVSSDRFAKDLGLVRKPLSYVVTALFVVTLVGWTAEPLADSLQLAINNLRVNAAAAEAQRELETALSRAQNAPQQTEPPASAESVQATTRALARAAVQTALRARVIDGLAGVQRPPLSETEFVRAAINEQSIRPAPQEDSAGAVRREAAANVRDERRAAALASQIDEYAQAQIRPQVEKLQRENPGAFARLARSMETRYAVPIAPFDAQSQLVARMVDGAIGAADVHPSSDIAKEAQKLVKEFGKGTVKNWLDAELKSYVANAITGSVRGEVIAHTAPDLKFESSRQAQTFARSLSEQEGRNWAAGGDAAREEKMSRAVASAVAQHAGSGPPSPQVLARMSGYDALFPANEDIPRGSVNGGGGGGGAGGGKGGRTPSGEAHAGPGRAFAQSRATSFHVAARSFRVRGVLFGRDYVPQGLMADDLRWTIVPATATESTKVVLALHTGNAWVTIGAFDAAVVNQAVRYAADRRVVATTIAPGDGKVVARVTFLHPALIDTPLGCRVVESDRLIDTFTMGQREPPSPDAATLRADRYEMERWRQKIGIASAVASLPPSDACPVARIEDIAKKNGFSATRFSPALQSGLDRFLDEQEAKSRGSTRFLRSANACASMDATQFSACVCGKLRSAGFTGPSLVPQDHTSQFREREETPTASLAFLRRTPDRLGHVDLWVHTTFALESRYTDPDEESATSLDFPAVELTALRGIVTSSLPAYLREGLHMSHEDFLGPLEDFIVVQRVMRMAFAGGFGPQFPVAKLIELQRATRQYVPYQPTIRWEAAQSSQALIEVLAKADPQAAKTYSAYEINVLAHRAAKRPTCDRVSK